MRRADHPDDLAGGCVDNGPRIVAQPADLARLGDDAKFPDIRPTGQHRLQPLRVDAPVFRQKQVFPTARIKLLGRVARDAAKRIRDPLPHHGAVGSNAKRVRVI